MVNTGYPALHLAMKKARDSERHLSSNASRARRWTASRHRHRAAATIAATAAIAALLSGCSSSDVALTSSKTSSAPTASALDRWNRAYSYLKVQTKPTEIVCTWLKSGGTKFVPYPRPVRFYNFADSAAWKMHIVTRYDPLPTHTFEDCSATVPTAVPYGPAIETFLSRYGLTFGPQGPTGLTAIEIAYAGQNSSDPDIIYHDEPGLFGLRLALTPLGQAPFEAGTSKIVQPTDEATATRYLRYAKPLLAWYGYTG